MLEGSPSFSICLLRTWYCKAHCKSEGNVLHEEFPENGAKHDAWRNLDRTDGHVNEHTQRHTNMDMVTTTSQPGLSRDSRECYFNETFRKDKVEHECWPGLVYGTHTHTHTCSDTHSHTDSGSRIFCCSGGHQAELGTRKLMHKVINGRKLTGKVNSNRDIRMSLYEWRTGKWKRLA